MIRALKRAKTVIWYFDEQSARIDGAPKTITGNLSGIRGDLSGISGDLSRITGDLSGISGHIDDCMLTDEEREAGVHIEALIEE